ncbi:hypothetical protein V6N13_076659 [Hibiscus sabdariffa]
MERSEENIVVCNLKMTMVKVVLHELNKTHQMPRGYPKILMLKATHGINSQTNANSPYKQPPFDLRLSPIMSPSGSSIIGEGGGGACDSGWAMPFSMHGSQQSGDDEIVNGGRSDGGGGGSWKRDGAGM